MRWFKNLNATPRLMISFGVLVALIAGISYLGVDSLGKANDRTGILYHDDLQGTVQVANIAKARLAIGKAGRDALIHIDDAAVVDADEKAVLSGIADIHANLDAATATFYTPEGLGILATMKSAMPAYEQGWADVLRLLRARNVAGAKASIDAVNKIGKPLEDASEHAIEVKNLRAGEKFQAGSAAYQSTRLALVAGSLVSVAFGVLISIVIARSFAVPLGSAVEILGRVAAGDLTAHLDVRTTDEVGRMSDALNEALGKLRHALQEVAASANAGSASSQELASAAGSIASGAQQQAASLEQTSASIGETSASLEETSASLEETSTSLEETSSSLEEITATIRQTADNAKQANQLASGSREAAESGQAVVSAAVAAMAEINAASAKIADIIGTIDEIAFQTNLLAVNAAVEAARAGEEGRGFAVVATEVRTLAQRSAGAAKEIKTLIQDSLRKVEKGTDLVNKSGETLYGIVSSVKRVTDIVAEIAAAAAEQSMGVDQVNTAMTQVSSAVGQVSTAMAQITTAVGQVSTAVAQMDQVTQSNAAQTEELSSTAGSMADQAQNLQVLVGAFILGDSPSGLRASSRPPAPKPVARPSVAPRAAAPAAKSVVAAKPYPRAAAKRPAAVALAAAGSSEASFEEF